MSLFAVGPPATHAPSMALSPDTALFVGAAGAAVVFWLWLRARYLRRRLRRAFTRSLSYGTSRRQLKSLRKRKVLARAGRARRATLRFRLAALLGLLLAAAWLYGHTHTR
ncbi:MAG TPA: hypothetical protein VGS97_05165 [Actinocrinis sp.]|uniref:hypothetical protein n=1 Tax=Actinocrinis sp. TaxID=1920516 RepID=UPI002DDD666F|nr:hypothetical protein [Actinocrinis sp.]HEV2343463.1 hypothetical protein [Actinocrinis sp.]